MPKIELIRFYMINFSEALIRRISICLVFSAIGILFLVFSFRFMPTQALAKVSADIDIKGSVGSAYLNLTGYISPYASIVLTSDGIFYRATVADKYGYFSISQVLIKEGFSHFCLEAIDIKRIGESITCFNFPPAKGSVDMKDIFLPPTLGLSRTEIGEGGTVIASGYSMPGAKVSLHLSNGKLLTTIADKTGYYEFILENVKAGKYELYSTAEFEEKPSLEPTSKVKLTALTLWEQIWAFIRDILNKIWRFVTSLSLGPLWIGIPIIISIIILVLKIWPEKFTFIYNSRLIALIPWRKKKLHHSWWMGY